MAGGDYYSCDKCDAKTFYDAALDYHEDSETFDEYLPGVGSMRVICNKCSITHKVVIVEKAPIVNGDKE